MLAQRQTCRLLFKNNFNDSLCACKHFPSLHSFSKSKLIIIIPDSVLFFVVSSARLSPDVQRQEIVCNEHSLTSPTHAHVHTASIAIKRTIHFRSLNGALPFAEEKERKKKMENSYFACFNPIIALSETNKIHNGDRHTVVE